MVKPPFTHRRSDAEHSPTLEICSSLAISSSRHSSKDASTFPLFSRRWLWSNLYDAAVTAPTIGQMRIPALKIITGSTFTGRTTSRSCFTRKNFATACSSSGSCSTAHLQEERGTVSASLHWRKSGVQSQAPWHGAGSIVRLDKGVSSLSLPLLLQTRDWRVPVPPRSVHLQLGTRRITILKYRLAHRCLRSP